MSCGDEGPPDSTVALRKTREYVSSTPSCWYSVGTNSPSTRKALFLTFRLALGELGYPQRIVS